MRVVLDLSDSQFDLLSDAMQRANDAHMTRLSDAEAVVAIARYYLEDMDRITRLTDPLVDAADEITVEMVLPVLDDQPTKPERPGLITSHVLQAGFAACGNLRTPNEWPAHHVVAKDPYDATCPSCRQAAEGTRDIGEPGFERGWRMDGDDRWHLSPKEPATSLVAICGERPRPMTNRSVEVRYDLPKPSEVCLTCMERASSSMFSPRPSQPRNRRNGSR